MALAFVREGGKLQNNNCKHILQNKPIFVTHIPLENTRVSFVKFQPSVKRYVLLNSQKRVFVSCRLTARRPRGSPQAYLTSLTGCLMPA